MKTLVEHSVEYKTVYAIPDDIWDTLEYGFDNARMFDKKLNFNQYFHRVLPEIKDQIVVSKPIKIDGKVNGMKLKSIILDELT